jgi:putative transcriptional regulator
MPVAMWQPRSFLAGLCATGRCGANVPEYFAWTATRTGQGEPAQGALAGPPRDLGKGTMEAKGGEQQPGVQSIPVSRPASGAGNRPNERNRFIMKQLNATCKAMLKSLGIRIVHLRTQKNWSQAQLAEACGMDDSHLGEIERGELDFCLGTAAKIAKGLGITISDLFAGVA